MASLSRPKCLREQIIADVDCLLSSPPLLDSEINFDTDLLTLPSGFDATPVEDFFAGNCSHRVGYYFESLVETLLKNDAAVSDLRRGIQIRENGETLGEVDFLFRRHGEVRHLEVALKYYLYSHGAEVRGSRLVGPNAADTFERKRDRLFTKQIPFGRERFPDVVRSELLVKGAIFYPWSNHEISIDIEGLSPGHQRGIWIADDQLELLFATLPEGSTGAVFEKPFWLGCSAGFAGETIELPVLFEKIAEIRRASRRPVLFGVGDLKDGRWRENLRGFVVSNDWPGLT